MFLEGQTAGDYSKLRAVCARMCDDVCKESALTQACKAQKGLNKLAPDQSMLHPREAGVDSKVGKYDEC
eukprot:16442638-Heterocapsa_arctica.AAC.1